MLSRTGALADFVEEAPGDGGGAASARVLGDGDGVRDGTLECCQIGQDGVKNQLSEVGSHLLLTGVRPAAEDDSIGPAVIARTKRGDPADGVTRKKPQVHAAVAQHLDAGELADIPVFIVTDADERLALKLAIGSEQVAIGTIGNVVTVLFEEVT